MAPNRFTCANVPENQKIASQAIAFRAQKRIKSDLSSGLYMQLIILCDLCPSTGTATLRNPFSEKYMPHHSTAREAAKFVYEMTIPQVNKLNKKGKPSYARIKCHWILILWDCLTFDTQPAPICRRVVFTSSTWSCVLLMFSVRCFCLWRRLQPCITQKQGSGAQGFEDICTCVGARAMFCLPAPWFHETLWLISVPKVAAYVESRNTLARVLEVKRPNRRSSDPEEH